MKILCFGVAREIVGQAAFDLSIEPGASVADLRRSIIETYPAFDELVDFAIARNEAYAKPSETIEAGDELVIIPPVSGA